jgi:hypothetical protein
MGRKNTKNTRQIGGEIDAKLWARWRTFCAGRKKRYGETHRQHLELALQRHIANPPPDLAPAVPPLPPIAAPAPQEKPA